MKREQAARLIAHPLRARILEAAAQGEVSPSDLAAEWGEPIGNVSYHARRLVSSKAVLLVRTKQVRGAIEHYYTVSDDGRAILRLLEAGPPLPITPLQAGAVLEALRNPRASVRQDPILGPAFEEALEALKAIADRADDEENHDAKEATT